ncbi:MAG TPA: PAS domain-containing protein, partial [Thermoanaerobaculia bacterium]|nr:PAS domain-containing protein [Thermoanaerobaculia bacterium]
MATDPGEVGRLRAAMRDLVALSTIPAAWVGREPAMIAAGLADALVGWLRLDFAFVRLRDPGGGAASEVIRGDAWKDFSHWLQRRDAAGRPPVKEIVPDVGGGEEPCPGLVIPVGVDGEAGLVAVACVHGGDYPSETDQLLLSVAANHAATAFQSARLVQERRSAAEELRQARDELETKVSERTAELHRTGSELRTILDASPLGLVLLRPDLAVQRCNAAFERLFGWTADEVVGRLFPVDERIEERWTPLAARLEGGHAFSGLEV